MLWGKWGKQLSTREMINLIQFCTDHGITSFDHADIYGDYTTEIDFGKAFSKSDIQRDSIELISKCGIQYIGETRSYNKIKHYDYSKDYIIWSVDTSLKNLGTDYLDLLLLHRPSPLMRSEEIAEAVLTLKNQGKIKQFGVSNFTPSQIELISQYIDLTVNQIEFSVTEHSAIHNGTLDQMMMKNITPMAWSPLGSIFKEKTQQVLRIKEQLENLKAVYNADYDQLLLAWVLKHPSSIHPVIGTTNKTRILNALTATTIDLKLEDWFSILVASQGHKVP